ncbi:MAG TPA: tripartite tricarboxylate transporter substrate binding protein [Firmicutes bacterium]|nr:tripartite tricarboxylate transporter substrate binding protein [Bacillota bacterium]
MKRYFVWAILVLFTGGLLLTGCGGQQATPQTETEWPQGPVELVVPWAAGGGSDRMARMINDIIQKNNLMTEPMMILNKPGGEGQIGEAYLLNKPGDPHAFCTVASGQISIPLSGQGDIKVTQFTPVAQVAADVELLVVRNDSPYETMADLVAAAQAAEMPLKSGGTATASEDHICNALLCRAAGIELNYIPFSGGGEVMTNLLGGHIDVAWANPSECMSQLEGGLARALAVSTTERLELKPDLPTFQELGYDFTFYQLRGIVGSPDMPAQAVQGMIEVLRQVVETEQWQKDYIEANMLVPIFLAGDDFTAAVIQQEQEFAEALAMMGLYKE